jgi:hypothetical protein
MFVISGCLRALLVLPLAVSPKSLSQPRRELLEVLLGGLLEVSLGTFPEVRVLFGCSGVLVVKQTFVICQITLNRLRIAQRTDAILSNVISVTSPEIFPLHDLIPLQILHLQPDL